MTYAPQPSLRAEGKPPASPPPPSRARAAAYLLLVGAVGLSLLASLALAAYHNFPQFEPSEYEHLKLPRSIQDTQKLATVLSHYKDRYYLAVMGGLAVLYVVLQTFSIPGSIFLNVLSGFLFPWQQALPLVCLCAALGASLCYLVSGLLCRATNLHCHLPHRARAFQLQVERNRSQLFYYLLFLRITPLLPNWLINITSPLFGVPLSTFFFGTLIGVSPPSLLTVKVGSSLFEMTSAADARPSAASMVVLLVVGVASLLPVLLRSRVQRHFD